ncbi:MAG: alpha-glucosidase, partial [Bacilli bacterium]|nr:alpha-glucosidase [Bacilli bacterium]
SPWQFLYWYDRPGISPNTGKAGGQKPSIVEVPELDFFDHIVTSWCETRVIHAVIGQYATVARRSGDNWFIGSMNGGLARTIKIPLDFLDSNKSYRAYVYVDDSSVPTVTKVRIDELEVAVDEVLTVDLPARGGQAIRIVPLT